MWKCCAALACAPWPAFEVRLRCAAQPLLYRSPPAPHRPTPPHTHPHPPVTLVTRDVHTPYSGMLPGYVSGFYSYDDVHIDLARLAAFASARLVHAEATGIDTQVCA